MTKLLVPVAVLVVSAVFVKRFASARHDVDFETRLEHMPEGAPRTWMFHNIAAIRANTDRILELLERDDARMSQSDGGPEAATPTTNRQE